MTDIPTEWVAVAANAWAVRGDGRQRVGVVSARAVLAAVVPLIQARTLCETEEWCLGLNKDGTPCVKHQLHEETA